MSHIPNDCELRDYHDEEMERRAQLKFQARHSYRPDCGCWSCEPERPETQDEDDDS